MSTTADTARGGGRRWTVTAEQAGQTVAAVLRELVPGLSWSKARELVRSGQVRVEGRPATDPAQRLRQGERIEMGAGGPEARRESELLVHLDAEVAVVRKPAGLLTVPFERTDRDTLQSRSRVAIRRLEASRGVPHNPSLRAVQRLDKETSGLVVFARTLPAQRELQRQFTEHTVLRRYLAVVHGMAREVTYDTMLVDDRGDGLRGSWRPHPPTPSPIAHPSPGRGGAPAQRRAVTHVTVEERLRGATLVSCRLETGRTHQIRIHLAEAGHPLLGETVYVRDFAGPWLPAPRLMLHAVELGFVHPRIGKELRFADPPPEDFVRVLAGLKLSTTLVVDAGEQT